MPVFFLKHTPLLFLLLTSCGHFQTQENVAAVGKGNYSFSFDWFSNNIPVWKKTLAGFKGQPGVRYLELGVYEGRSLVWMLENILTHPTARAVAVDLFPGKLLATLQQNLEVTGSSQKVEIVKGLFRELLGKMPSKSFDIIYLDGGHMSWMTLETALLAWPLLKDGGILIFDDYLWHQEWPVEFAPKAAVDAFILSHKNFVDVLEQNYQMYIQKVSTSCQVLDDYACTPMTSWSYSWDRKSLWDSATKTEFKLNLAQQANIEGLIRKYHTTQGTTRFQHAIVSDRLFSKFIGELSSQPAQQNSAKSQ